MAASLNKATGSLLCFRESEIALDHHAQSERRAGPCAQLFRLRVHRKAHLAQGLRGRPARCFKRDRADRAERQAALLGTDAVLDDPCALAAAAEPNAEARHRLVKRNEFSLALG